MVKKQFEESSEAENIPYLLESQKPDVVLGSQEGSSQASLEVKSSTYYLEDKKSISTEDDYIL